MKTILKLLVVAVIANASWHAWLVYSSYFKFKDAIEAEASRPNETDDELRARVLDLASEYDVPLSDDGFTLRRESPDVGEQHTIIEGSYSNTVEVLPGVVVPVNLPFRVEAAYIRIK
jgi:hypothetical protein